MSNVTLVMLQPEKTPIHWTIGEKKVSKPDVRSLTDVIKDLLLNTNTDAVLFWDNLSYLPSNDLIEYLLESSNDVWHAGLRMGLSGKPEMLNYVNPTWMLNRDPDPNKTATSWRLSLRACLFRTEVLRQIGTLEPGFETLEGAGLELGYRCIRAGVFIRYIPELLPVDFAQEKVIIPLADQLRFIQLGFGGKWAKWTKFRTVLANPRAYFSTAHVQKIAQGADTAGREVKPYQRSLPTQGITPSGKVSVLIPTIRRYPYLRTLLGQLRNQTVPPYEIIVVDQTPQSERDAELPKDFSDLPVRWHYLDKAGQCSSRNMGLRYAQGDYVLFVDDDDEVSSDLIEKHLRNLNVYKCSISSGAALEPDQKELPADFRFLRLSNVFPTNNTMIRKDVLRKSGLFDLAYDHGQRADHDLGMRLYLAGELMVLNPSICLLHHHAPMGGLREHKARVHTYAKSRTSVWHFNLLTVSDLYLAKRYFTSLQVRESRIINLLGTFSIHGSKLRKILKALVALVLLPKNIYEIRKRNRIADQWLKVYPQIPQVQEGAVD
jgi:glycosyltransferase involved in cell wall biosynthesis